MILFRVKVQDKEYFVNAENVAEAVKIAIDRHLLNVVVVEEVKILERSHVATPDPSIVHTPDVKVVDLSKAAGDAKIAPKPGDKQ